MAHTADASSAQWSRHVVNAQKISLGWPIKVQVSKTTARTYMFNATTGECRWEDPALTFQHDSIAVCSSTSPVAVAPPASSAPPAPPALVAPRDGMPVPCLDNVRVDVYVPRYKSRGAWTMRQLGVDLARQEVEWWQGACKDEPKAAAATASAHARLGIEQGTQRDALLDPSEDVGTQQLLSQLLTAFVHAVTTRIGKDAFASTWDSKREAYVIARELSSPSSGGAVAPPAISTDRKRRRDDESIIISGRIAPAAASGPAMPRIAPRDSVPRLAGGAVYRATELQPHAHIQALFKSGKIESKSGIVRKLASAVGPYEGFHLYKLVLDNAFSRTLEVGVANGMSTLYITAALERVNADGKHFGIDPFQSSQWDNAGRASLERAGLSHRCTIIEEPSYLAMPNLLREGHGQQFDLVLVDGMHLFDYTLVDLFYADLLVRVGGVVVLDDIRHAGVADTLRYISANYVHWQRISNTICSDTMATFVKLAPDTRAWDFHVAM